MSSHDALAEPPMLVEGHEGGEGLAAVEALDLLAAVGVHPLVAAEIRELRVGLEADLAAERLDALVDVLVLFQSARRCKVLAALRAGVRPRGGVGRTGVVMQDARIGEDLVTLLARVTSE